MDLGTQKILVASLISLFTFLTVALALFFAPVPWETAPPLAKEIFLIVMGVIWAITMIAISKASYFKLYIGKYYTPEGEVIRGSRNEKIFLAIIIAFVLILILCAFVAFSIMSQFP